MFPPDTDDVVSIKNIHQCDKGQAKTFVFQQKNLRN